MCGITGMLSLQYLFERQKDIVRHMMRAIAHRGPDGEGVYHDPETKIITLGHKRLAIIDPAHGKQPMSTKDGLFTLIFNGAIYNYLELKAELIQFGFPIQSHSDTEVLLYAYVKWGAACLEKLRGMFSFAIWDKRDQTLFCARDRLGIKPFYFYHDQEKFLFASEIKALISSGVVRSEINLQSLQDYITFQFCLNEKTLFKNIYKLKPGHFLIADLKNSKINIEIKEYWDVNYHPVDETHDEKYFVEQLQSLLYDSVKEHLRADVPLGAHLSGGLDSSTVVSLASSMLNPARIKTFTGKFNEGKQFDETVYAKTMAEAAAADYHEAIIPSHEFSSILPQLIYFMDEPAAGPGLIPQYFVSKLAAQHVKVVLGGQGGDEIYIGYARYLIAYLEKCLKGALVDPSGKQDISLQDISSHLSLLRTYQPMLQYFLASGLFDEPAKRYFRLVDRSEGTKQLFHPDIYKNYSSYDAFEKIFHKPDSQSLINQMTYFDLKASLPALLQVEDRTSMAVSLESRVPLLDHRLIDFMASIPSAIKFSGGQMKYLFKAAIENILPGPILNRKDKMGFPVPLQQWMQGKDKEFVFDILLSQRARERGLYNVHEIEKMLSQGQSFSRVGWGLLCLELWCKAFVDGDQRSLSPNQVDLIEN